MRDNVVVCASLTFAKGALGEAKGGAVDFDFIGGCGFCGEGSGEIEGAGM